MRFHRQMSGRNRRLPSSSSSSSSFVFRSRSLTALALLVVLAFALGHFFAGGIAPSKLRGGIPNSNSNPSFLRPHAFNENNAARSARNLIVVAGHSVTVSGHLHDSNHDENDWYLLDYQKHQGLPEAIVAHIKAGIEAVRADPTSLLIFSGGETRAQTGPDTEGASYFRVADALDLWQPVVNGTSTTTTTTTTTTTSDTFPARSRTASEDFARDSFENLLFSICRFFEVTGRYPESITVISFTYKRRRFEELHRAALRWPAPAFRYIGLDPPASTGFDIDKSTRGELENAAQPFESDPYGCHSQVLKDKREQRNPFARTAPYTLSCPSMKKLLEYCGPSLIDPSLVPWP